MVVQIPPKGSPHQRNDIPLSGLSGVAFADDQTVGAPHLRSATERKHRWVPGCDALPVPSTSKFFDESHWNNMKQPRTERQPVYSSICLYMFIHFGHFLALVNFIAKACWNSQQYRAHSDGRHLGGLVWMMKNKKRPCTAALWKSRRPFFELLHTFIISSAMTYTGTPKSVSQYW